MNICKYCEKKSKNLKKLCFFLEIDEWIPDKNEEVFKKLLVEFVMFCMNFSKKKNNWKKSLDIKKIIISKISEKILEEISEGDVRGF